MKYTIKRYADGDEKPVKLPTKRKQIRHVCLWVVGITSDDRARKCNAVFKSFDALKDHINEVHKDRKRKAEVRGGMQIKLAGVEV